ncbi:MAG: SulP family inorganic anion transporter [Cyanobium sp. CZS 48M]|nr:SulP family inorganic anion transporter [Cyanobium sp. CZS48M]
MSASTPPPTPLSPSANPRIKRRQTPTGWRRWVPGLSAIGHYRIAWLRHDIVAGLALTAVLLPVGIAYAVASGVPAICGLYATIFGLFAYALFGPSRMLVLGPDSSLVALILGIVLPLSGGDSQRAMALAGMLALVSGSLCVLAGTARLGFITELLSKPIRYGYMNGIALTVLVSQLPALFGFTVKGDGLLIEARSFVAAVLAGSTNGASLALGVGTLLMIGLLRRSRRFPGGLLAVVTATVSVSVLNLATRFGVTVLGPLPRGLPALSIPSISTGDLVPVLLGGCAIALVSFADTSVLSRTYAARLGDTIDANQEMVGLGAANLVAGLFQGLPISASTSRTPVAEAAGAKSQLTGVVGAVTVAALLLAAPNLLRNLPTAALAGVVIASAITLIEVADLRRIYRMQRWEFWLSMVCLAGVAVFGAIPGIGLAIVIAVIEFLWDGWRPHSAVLGRVDGVKGYHDIGRYPESRLVPGLVLFRWDAPLFFANAEFFRDRVMTALESSPTQVNWLVVEAEPVTSIDVTSADTLDELDHTLAKAGIMLGFAEMKDPVKDKLKRFGLFSQFGEERFFATVGEAVSCYLKAHSVDWVDWEDQAKASADASCDQGTSDGGFRRAGG